MRANLLAFCVVTWFLLWWGGVKDTMAEQAFRHRDTTPPTVSVPTPPMDSTVTGDAIIFAKFADEGSGIDVTSARFLLDGKDVARQAKVTTEGIMLTPKKPLAKGIHWAETIVSDKAGNQSNRLKWRFGVDVPVPVEAKFDKGLFLVSGEPFFPMGIYNYSCNPGGELFDELVLEQVTAAGFNTLLYGEGSKDALDMLLKHGIKALVSVWRGLHECTDPVKAKEALVEKGAVRFKEHPAVLGYWADSPDATFYHSKVPKDEALRRMTLAYKTVKEHDPNHPVIWCFAHRDTFKDYIGTSDALMTFFYPIGQAGFTVPSISEIMIKPAKEAAGEKRVWFISQAIDLSLEHLLRKPKPEEFRPTPQEMRAMNYLALVEGVKGLIIYASGGSRKPGLYNNLVEYPAQWQGALKIASEVRYLSPVLAAGKEVRTVRLEPEKASSSIRFRELEHEKMHYLITVNVTEATVEVTWHFPKPVQPMVLFEDRVFKKKATEMVDKFKPYEVHIYCWE